MRQIVQFLHRGSVQVDSKAEATALVKAAGQLKMKFLGDGDQDNNKVRATLTGYTMPTLFNFHGRFYSIIYSFSENHWYGYRCE